MTCYTPRPPPCWHAASPLDQTCHCRKTHHCPCKACHTCNSSFANKNVCILLTFLPQDHSSGRVSCPDLLHELVELLSVLPHLVNDNQRVFIKPWCKVLRWMSHLAREVLWDVNTSPFEQFCFPQHILLVIVVGKMDLEIENCQAKIKNDNRKLETWTGFCPLNSGPWKTLETLLKGISRVILSFRLINSLTFERYFTKFTKSLTLPPPCPLWRKDPRPLDLSQ